MALPRLSNDRPIYEMVIPSTKETVKFRPFLVKEQKSLLVAFESQDQKQILNSMLVCIESCVPGVDVKKLATFDVDYMFTQVRSKSVGETSTVLSACTECNEENEVQINLTEINVESNGIKTDIVQLNDEISVELKFPTYEDTLVYTNSEASTNVTENLFNSIASCLNAVQTKDENILIRQEPREEVDKFINSLTNEQLEKITNFINTMPTLMYEKKYNCKKCGHENTLQMKGLQDFF
jgi:transcription elongation factor Elf1